MSSTEALSGQVRIFFSFLSLHFLSSYIFFSRMKKEKNIFVCVESCKERKLHEWMEHRKKKTSSLAPQGFRSLPRFFRIIQYWRPCLPIWFHVWLHLTSLEWFTLWPWTPRESIQSLNSNVPVGGSSYSTSSRTRSPTFFSKLIISSCRSLVRFIPFTDLM